MRNLEKERQAAAEAAAEPKWNLLYETTEKFIDNEGRETSLKERKGFKILLDDLKFLRAWKSIIDIKEQLAPEKQNLFPAANALCKTMWDLAFDENDEQAQRNIKLMDEQFGSSRRNPIPWRDAPAEEKEKFFLKSNRMTNKCNGLNRRVSKEDKTWKPFPVPTNPNTRIKFKRATATNIKDILRGQQ